MFGHLNYATKQDLHYGHFKVSSYLWNMFTLPQTTWHRVNLHLSGILEVCRGSLPLCLVKNPPSQKPSETQTHNVTSTRCKPLHNILLRSVKY